MFYKMKGMRDGHRNECKACNNAAKLQRYRQNPQATIDRANEWRRSDPERFAECQRKYRARGDRKVASRAGHLKRKFRLTLDQYDQSLASQGGGCAICGDTPEGGTSLHIDHDHDTGAVRGLLCVRCNNALGQLKEDAQLVRAAAAYIDGNDAAVVEEVGLARARARLLIGAGH